MSPDRMTHKSNADAVLFDLGGGVVDNQVELFDFRHLSCAMVLQVGLYM